MIKSSVYGAFGGAVALAVVGFGWGGWVTAGSAELTAKTRSENAVVAVLAPICATQFQKAPDAAAQQAALVAKGSWEQKKLVEAAGWACASLFALLVTSPGPYQKVSVRILERLAH